MADGIYDIEHNEIYRIGMNMGFFAAFLLFASVFYFIMMQLNRIPRFIKYYHILLFVVIAYFIGFAALKFKK